MKCKKNNKTAKQRNEETEEDKKIIDIVCKLGGGFIKEKFGYISALKHREAKDLLEKKEIQTRLFEKTHEK